MDRILLVENDVLNCDMLQRRLEREGFEVTVAVNGREAIEMGTTEPPDAILMDVGLPEINGLDATRILRMSDAGANVLIIALTAHAMLKDHEKVMKAGCDEYMSKPVDFPLLLARIDHHLNSKRDSSSSA